MKKLIGLLAMVMLLAACGSKEESKPYFKSAMALPFEIVHYEEKISPSYENLVPHIAYAKTEGQFEELSSRFQVENANIDVDFEKDMILFVVEKTNSCGIVADNVYDKDGDLSVQMTKPESDNCEVEPVPHTFVIKVAQGDYERVQLYEGDILKSTMEIKE